MSPALALAFSARGEGEVLSEVAGVGEAGPAAPPGTDGTDGQYALTRVASSAYLLESTTFVPVSELTQYIVNASDGHQLLHIATSGTARFAGAAIFDVAIYVDNERVHGGTRRIGTHAWQHAAVATVAPGAHTISIRAKLVAGGRVTLGHATDDALQSTLTIFAVSTSPGARAARAPAPE